MNKIMLIGRLVRDTELKYSANGTAIANFTLAVDRPFKNKDGEKEADFIRVVAFKGAAELAANHFKKGKPVAVEGRLQTRSYEKDGRRVYVSEVVADRVEFLPRESKKEEIEISDEDLPF